jgi:hypothetical protein
MMNDYMTCKMTRAGELVLFAFVSLFSFHTLSAQNEMDVLRYSLTESLGSIRTTGMGGAYGSLGADLASSVINPAGIGMYRRGDASLSMGLHSSKTKTSIRSSISLPQTENDLSATVGSIGLALTIPSVNPDWPFVTVAISHHKRAIFNQVLKLEDTEFQQSLLGVFQDLATGVHNEDLYDVFPHNASLAWETYLLDPDGDDNYNYVTPFETNTPVMVDRTIERSGNMGETQYSFGGTFRDRISVGATVGTSKVYFSEDSRHTETPLDPGTDLAEWTYYESLVVEGTGIIGRVGLIANISKWMRIGVAWHSPTRLRLTDSYSMSVNSTWKDGEVHTADSPEGGYEYLIVTPSKTIVSGSFLIGKIALLSADYETTDLSNGKLKDVESWLSPEINEFEAENASVEASYNRIHEVRIGLEMRIAKNWRIRSGTGMATSPYSMASGVMSNGTRYKASLGTEFRNEDWYAGVAWTRSWFEEDLYFLDPELQGDPANLSRSLGMLSIGAGKRL